LIAHFFTIEFCAMLLSNNLPYDEVVDTFADGIEIYRKIRTPLNDGLQFTDILAVYDAYPQTVEIYNDRKVFLEQFLDLTPEESVLVMDEVAERTGTPRDNVEAVAFKSLRVASRTYRLVRHNLEEGKEILLDIKEIAGVDSDSLAA
jgi:hypothetical protein